MEPFLLHDITNPEFLFGRESLLKQLLVDASLKGNVNVVGARRFGKTCLVKCTQTIIKADDTYSVYPVYFDFKSEQIQGTDMSYQYMVAKLTEDLFVDGYFTEPERFGTVTITPSDDWTDIMECLRDVKGPRAAKLLERFVKFMSKYIGKTIIFIIDEYEYLFKSALDSAIAFMKLRQLSGDLDADDGFKFFAFWLVGCTTWDEFCVNHPGSGEANTISEKETVKPISEYAFEKMWLHECSLIDDKQIDRISYLKENWRFAFEKSGGVPCYGKDRIGKFMYKNMELPNYTVLNDLFKELTSKAISTGEYKLLRQLSIQPQKISKSSIALDNLLDKGLVVKKHKDIYEVAIPFLKDFIIASVNDTSAIKQPKTVIEELVIDIIKLVETINNQRVLQKKDPLFKLVIDASTMEQNLRTPCYTSDQLVDFSSALYKYYFERTKETRGTFLHKKYFSPTEENGSVFAKCADLCRHIYGKAHERDEFRQRPGQFNITDMLMVLTGSTNEPYTSDEFLKIQTELLTRFKTELGNMLKDIRK